MDIFQKRAEELDPNDKDLSLTGMFIDSVIEITAKEKEYAAVIQAFKDSANDEHDYARTCPESERQNCLNAARLFEEAHTWANKNRTLH